MAKNIPTNYAPAQDFLVEYAAQDAIETGDNQAIADAQHYHWARRGAKIGGLVWDTALPFVPTSNVSFTTGNVNASTNLNAFHGHSKLQRLVNNGGVASYSVNCVIVGRDIDVRVQATDKTGTVLTSWIVSAGATMGCYKNNAFLTEAVASGVCVWYNLVAQGTGPNSQLLALDLHEEVVTDPLLIPVT